MRLDSIKLSGFKSFVDSTTVNFPKDINAVVGPNGSGKSNIIDAVRWVMGESSAKNLRGESMTDVIFNGSTGRKPVGQASIELIFDNSEGKLGGEYASYQTISVKRVVTRDAQSSYFLNGQKCRRKDITHLFLGTGLGPRSYAIIMQDTISRLIEAKPEELRVYLEEVAGISKYKERRRETELRMQHTHENLERLTDLREELEKQLNHLQRQARAAERFKDLKQEQRLVKAQLMAIQWRELDEKLKHENQQTKEAEVALEAAISRLRAIDAESEQDREAQIEINEQFNEVQKRYYGVGSEIGRLEQSKQHQMERKSQLQRDYDNTDAHLTKALEQLHQDKAQITQLEQQEQSLAPQIEHLQQESIEAQEALIEAEDNLIAVQQTWDEFQQNSSKHLNTAEIEQARMQQLEQRLQEVNSRIQRLQQEQMQLRDQNDSEQIEQIKENCLLVQEEFDSKQSSLSQIKQRLDDQRNTNREAQQRLDQKHSELQQLNGQLVSLKALQKAALGEKDEETMAWLQEHHFDKQPRLAYQLQVQSGWEHAVETVLGAYLEAICVSDLTNVATSVASLNKGHITFVSQRQVAPISSSQGYTSLSSKVTHADEVQGYLSQIFCANSLQEALAMQDNLAAHQSVITHEGFWVGQGWLRVSLAQDTSSSVIKRQQAIAALEDSIANAEAELQLAQQQLESGREQVQAFEQEREQGQTELRQVEAKLAQTQADLHARQREFTKAQERTEQLAQELLQTQELCNTLEQDILQAKQKWQEALVAAEQDSLKREHLQQNREQAREQVAQLREKAFSCKESLHQLTVQQHSAKAQLTAIWDGLERSESQIKDLRERSEEFRTLFEACQEPLFEIETQLDDLLQQQLVLEDELSEAKDEVARFENKLRELVASRNKAETDIESARANVEQNRMAQQTFKVKRTAIEEQFEETQFELTAVINELPEVTDSTQWQESLDELDRKIGRLGAINLAAIDEYKSVAERKEYLDAQNEDLVDAMNTLENAIRKIDKETKQRFRDTFDLVNEHFQHLFPKIFGGGSAMLELTDDDLLATGVRVMARPPGKRNSTIHLLSGGEKALTALSLVFSLFQLNPAPFCLLDEVDAPLDDANIGRFCSLVKEMAKEVQFIFISHNKLAIEMANHLTGVSMREPGVSRLVAVDVEQAVALAEAS